MVYYISWFLDIEPILHPGDKSFLVMAYNNHFEMFLGLTYNILLMIFESIFIKYIDLLFLCGGLSGAWIQVPLSWGAKKPPSPECKHSG